MARSGTLQLHTGREISLRRLTQWGTYEGLLEGLPTRENNLQLLDHLLAAERLRAEHPPCLIQPPQTAIATPRGEAYPFGTPARLPSIVCVGEFESSTTARDPEADYSALTIIWFQDDFALPIDKRVAVRIEAIDWETQARDVWF